jgi:hypothetical protein
MIVKRALSIALVLGVVATSLTVFAGGCTSSSGCALQ